MNIAPPGVRPEWDRNPVEVQAELIAYYQLRDYEHQDEQINMAKMLAR